MADGHYTCAPCASPVNEIESRITNRKIRPKNIRITCGQCGKDFATKRAGTATRKFCSRKCATSHCAPIAGKRRHLSALSGVFVGRHTAVSVVACSACSAQFLGKAKYKLKQYCLVHRTSPPTYWEMASRKKPPISCGWCGVQYCKLYQRGEGGAARLAFCSDDCRRRARRLTDASTKQRRNRRIKGAHAGRVSYAGVLRRDNWTCQGCGCHTPKELRGTLDDNATEIDHIVPLSKCGSHSMDNLQVLCRVCNWIKSDRAMSDLLIDINGLGRGGVALERPLFANVAPLEKS